MTWGNIEEVHRIRNEVDPILRRGVSIFLIVAWVVLQLRRRGWFVQNLRQRLNVWITAIVLMDLLAICRLLGPIFKPRGRFEHLRIKFHCSTLLRVAGAVLQNVGLPSFRLPARSAHQAEQAQTLVQECWPMGRSAPMPLSGAGNC